MIELRPYQKDAIAKIYRAFGSGKKSALCALPTGAGKSIIIAKMAVDAHSKGRRTLILVHRTKLANQLKATLEREGLKPAMIVPGSKPDYIRNNVFIAMVQTIERRELPADIGLVMLDEAHSSSYFAVWSKIMATYSKGLLFKSPCFFLGLTATPYRTNKKQGFCQFFQVAIQGATDRELMKDGFLTQTRIFAYETSLDEKALELDASGDYTASSLIKACNDEYLSDVANRLKTLYADKKTIIFTSDVNGCESLSQKLNDLGLKSKAIHSKTPSAEKDTIFEAFDKNEIRFLVSVAMLTEGFDQPDIEVVVIARPTRSLAAFKQMAGRGLRLSPGKEECLLLDFGNCVQNFQSKDKISDLFDVRRVGFCGRHKRPNPNLKECPNCQAEIISFAVVCPECGHEYPKKERDKPILNEFPSLVEVLQGESVEQFNWLRKTIVTQFLKGKDFSDAIPNFRKKYGFLPHKDWSLGAIFGKKGLANPEIHAQILNYALMHSSRHLPRELIQFQVELEFGIPGKTYFIDGIKFEGKRLPETPLTPWDIFECDRFVEKEKLYESYHKLLERREISPNALNYLLSKATEMLIKT